MKKLIDTRSAITGAGLVAIVFSLASFQEGMTYRTPEGEAGPAPFIVPGTELFNFRIYGEEEPQIPKSSKDEYIGLWRVVAAPGGPWVQLQSLYVHQGDFTRVPSLGHTWIDWSRVVEYEVSSLDDGENDQDEDGR